MTIYKPADTGSTNELVRFVSQGSSWLRHSNGAGRLDWALLHGATAEELEEIRGGWLNHIDHLRRVHCIDVEQGPIGFYRIVGARSCQSIPAAGVADDGASDGEEDAGILPEGDIPVAWNNAPVAAEALNTRFRHSAIALMALHGAGELTNPMHKAAVGMIIRQASECNHWHNSAHFRSAAAARMIAAAEIRTPAQYQAYCRQNLRHEHMVPNIVLYRMIIAKQALTLDWILDLFERFSKRATITITEDRTLRVSDMPDVFYTDGHEWFEDPYARYLEVRLMQSLVARQGPHWFVP